jgi:hypothetical protein
MAYFAWHKLGSTRKLISLFTPGCTAICCCGPDCPNSVDPNESENPFVDCSPYPVDFPESFCCVVPTGINSWCPPTNGQGTAIGVCYSGFPRNILFYCTTWIGTIDENGNTTWVYAGLNTPNCSGAAFGTNDTTPGPLTTRITVGNDSNGGTAAFIVQRGNATDYLEMRYVDPAFAWETPPRYYRTPLQPSSVPSEIYETPMCLRLNIPSNVPTRTMVLSGYNKYRYSGYLTNDAQVYTSYDGGVYEIPKIINAPGASGLSQMEGSLGRSFPASDDVLTFPIWGASGSYLGLSCDEDDCTFQTIQDIAGDAEGFCVGDDCLRVQENDATGHYLSMVSSNLTGHYHSFSGYNPYVKFWEGSTGFVGIDDNGNDSAYVNGTGLPTCSLYSLAWALYDRSWRSVIDPYHYPGVTHTNETDLLNAYPTEFANVRSKLNSLINDDPRNLTGTYGESVVTYWFNQLNQSIVDFYTAFISNESGFIMPTHYNSSSDPETLFGAFTTPKVILWNKTAFINASTNTDRWKHLYIPGSANVLFDSGCTHTGGDWKAYKFTLDEATHNMAWGSVNAARIIQFRVCDASDTQINSNTLISLSAIADVSPAGFCSLCATSSAPFNMGEDDCITGPRPEIWGDSTVGTDYTPSGGGGGLG